eukprot:Pgem_evm1s13418
MLGFQNTKYSLVNGSKSKCIALNAARATTISGCFLCFFTILFITCSLCCLHTWCGRTGLYIGFAFSTLAAIFADVAFFTAFFALKENEIVSAKQSFTSHFYSGIFMIIFSAISLLAYVVLSLKGEKQKIELQKMKQHDNSSSVYDKHEQQEHQLEDHDLEI